MKPPEVERQGPVRSTDRGGKEEPTSTQPVADGGGPRRLHPQEGAGDPGRTRLRGEGGLPG